MTNMTRAYYKSVLAGNPDPALRDAIIHRHEFVYGSLGNATLNPLLDNLAQDLTPDPNKTEADYVSLGEEYSGRLLAKAIGGLYMDPSHIKFSGGSYRLDSTVNNLRQARASAEFHTGQPIVYAGFYGYDVRGYRYLLDGGGSDRTAAALAIGLDSDFYGKWSDIEGIHTANPNDVEDTVIRPALTFSEIREYSLGGNPVLNGMTPVDLDSHNWDGSLVIRSTQNPAEAGTRITNTRDVDPTNPVAAIASRDVDMISFNDLGMAHAVGYVSRATGQAEELGLSISHFPAGNDALTFVVDPDKGVGAIDGNDQLSYPQKLEILEGFLKDETLSPNAQVTVEQDRALLVLVGEALRIKDVRALTTARLNLALLRGGVAVRDTLGNIQSPSLIFEIDRKETARSQTLAHSEFVSDPVLKDLVKLPSRVLKQIR